MKFYFICKLFNLEKKIETGFVFGAPSQSYKSISVVNHKSKVLMVNDAYTFVTSRFFLVLLSIHRGGCQVTR